MKVSEVAKSYSPLTSSTRVVDLDIPETIEIRGEEIVLPKCLRKKDVHYLVDSKGQNTIRASWISGPLSHILNAYRLSDPEAKAFELIRAIKCIDKEICELIRNGILRDRKGPGAMAFVQANESVPEDSILISERTYKALSKHNPIWRDTASVMAIRFPNLGPETTRELKVIINKVPEYQKGTTASFLDLAPSLKDIYEDLGGTAKANNVEIYDAFYLNPNTLKGSFEGDGDGDQMFLVVEKRGHPEMRQIPMRRSPGPITQEMIDTMVKKADRCEEVPLSQWLPTYFDDLPIGQATYAIRWMLYNKLKDYKDYPHPMNEAWKEVAPKAIKIIEFVMDVRKGEFTAAEVKKQMSFITSTSKEIRNAQIRGNWFALTVTNRGDLNVASFIKAFPTLQDFTNHIIGQKTK